MRGMCDWVFIRGCNQGEGMPEGGICERVYFLLGLHYPYVCSGHIHVVSILLVREGGIYV